MATPPGGDVSSNCRCAAAFLRFSVHPATATRGHTGRGRGVIPPHAYKLRHRTATPTLVQVLQLLTPALRNPNTNTTGRMALKS
jgi:hypothetical protein